MTSYCSDNPNGLIIESVETFFEDKKMNEWSEWIFFFIVWWLCMQTPYKSEFCIQRPLLNN